MSRVFRSSRSGRSSPLLAGNLTPSSTPLPATPRSAPTATRSTSFATETPPATSPGSPMTRRKSKLWVDDFLPVAPALRGRIMGVHGQTWEHCFAVLTPQRPCDGAGGTGSRGSGKAGRPFSRPAFFCVRTRAPRPSFGLPVAMECRVRDPRVPGVGPAVFGELLATLDVQSLSGRTASTGQVASKRIRWTVLPRMSLPTMERCRSPITIMSTCLSWAI